jgi:Secretion system C-terminal sorting domain
LCKISLSKKVFVTISQNKEKIMIKIYNLKAVLLTCFVCLVFSSKIFAQSKKVVQWRDLFSNPKVNFYDLQKAFEKEEEKEEKRIKRAKRRGIILKENEGFEIFKRWEAYAGPRVYPSGDLTLPSSAYANFLAWQQNNSINNKKTRAGSWYSIGPIGKPVSTPALAYRTGTGRINFIRFDPKNNNNIFIGTPDGGLWRSTNGGTSWTTNTDLLTAIGSSDLVIDSSNTQIMYLATGDLEGDRRSIGILKSTNGGNTWLPTSLAWTAIDDYKISKLLMDPAHPNIMIAATNNGIFRTTDGWVTYTAGNFGFTPLPDLKDMEFKPFHPTTIYAAGVEIYKSTDSGANWIKCTSGLPSTDIKRIALAVTPADSGFVYALMAKENSSFRGIYLSTNGAADFSERTTSPNILGYEANGSDLTEGQGFYDLAINVSPSNAANVTTATINTWQSADSGATWSIVTHWTGDSSKPIVHSDFHDLTYSANSILFSGGDGGISRSQDNGISWTDLSNNVVISQVNRIGISQTDANLVIAGMQDNGTNFKSGAIWSNIFGGDGGESFIDHSNNNTIYFCFINGEMHRSDDGGTTETQITTGIPTGSSSIEFYSSFHQDPDSASWLYAGGRSDFYKSEDKGDSWNKLGTPAGTENIMEFAIAPKHNQIIYAIKKDAISKSTDGGVTFSDITGTLPVTSAALTMVAVSSLDTNQVWVTFSGYSAGNKVFKSKDGGMTWVNMSVGLPNIPMNTIVLVNDSLSKEAAYIGADIGIYFTDTITPITPFMTNLPNVAVRDLEIYYPTRKIRAATYGRGVWESDLFVNVPLSIHDYVTLNGIEQKGQNVLNWNTNFNAISYEITKSVDGVSFSKIHDQINDKFEFQFIDSKLAEGTNYYRIIGNFGNYNKYSNVVALNHNNASLKVYPNPVANEVNIELINSSFGIRIINSKGQTVYFANSIYNKTIVKTNELPNGMYIVEVQSKKGRKQSSTITIQH